MSKLLFIITISTVILVLLFCQNIIAAERFTANYNCSDLAKTCVSSGTRIIDGFSVTKDCWEYSYVKQCNYPSSNDCYKYAHCYAVADLACLLRDNYGNCVNLQKEFSCKNWQKVTYDQEMVRVGLVEKQGVDKLICKGVPCIDGNCVDKSYLTDGDMMDSVSKLYAISKGAGATDLNFKLFEGFSQHCSKKATSYTNCCSLSLKGWGINLGAGCNKDESDLIDKRQKNLCVYVGKENKQTMGVTTVVKHHYCCFGNLLNKVIQVEGRAQLGLNFGSGGSTNCRGLTLEELMKLDFDRMDFSEFYADILKRMKLPKVGDISARVSSSLPNVRKYDGNINNKENNKSGINKNMVDDSSEAEEERRTESLNQTNKTQRKIAKEQELADSKDQLSKAKKELEIALIPFRKGDGYWVPVNSPHYPEYQRKNNIFQASQKKVQEIESELKSDKY